MLSHAVEQQLHHKTIKSTEETVKTKQIQKDQTIVLPNSDFVTLKILH